MFCGIRDGWRCPSSGLAKRSSRAGRYRLSRRLGVRYPETKQRVRRSELEDVRVMDYSQCGTRFQALF